MAQRLRLLLALVALTMGAYAAGRALFLLVNAPDGLAELWPVWAHGAQMDLSVRAYIAVLPWLLCLCPFGLRPRRWLAPYYIIIYTLVALTIVADAVMYSFWHFKLDATVLAYLHNPAGVTNSVSPGFILMRTAWVVGFAAQRSLAALRLTPKRLPKTRLAPTLLLAGPLLFLCIRGGVRESTMNVGYAYYSPSLFLNHAAVNPTFSFGASLSKQKDFKQQHRYMADSEAQQIVDSLYASAPDIADTLLRVSRPNVLIVVMESFGTACLTPEIAPRLRQIAAEGVYFSNMWSASFRTDRGLVCALSGWTSYPAASLMRIPGRTAGLPSIANTLAQEGYSTDYLYGGDIKIMGKQGYLVSTAYRTLTSINAFTLREANESKWGVNDSITARRTLSLLGEREEPWHFVWQTLSSHEPWEVPYKRLDDPVSNAFAFTDHCIGQLIDSLRRTPMWDNTLVVLLPDHPASVGASFADEEFFRSPMIWTGGAIKKPCEVNVLLSQSDMAATLLAQMGLPSDDFPWSRNALSQAYRPSAYSTYPSGACLRDADGLTVVDLGSRTVVGGTPSPQRERAIRALLQVSHGGI